MLKNPQHPKKTNYRSRECLFTKSGFIYVDYKNIDVIKKFTNDQGENPSTSCNRYKCKISATADPCGQACSSPCIGSIRSRKLQITGATL